MRKILLLLLLFILGLGVYRFVSLSALSQIERPSVLSAASQLASKCEAGFVLVPGSSLYQTKDFCVMKYDAKCALTTNPSVGLVPSKNSACDASEGVYKNSGVGCACSGQREVVSTASGAPITFIPEVDASSINAKSYCESRGWHLMTNPEWMTIARNAEQVAANWCNPDGTNCNFPPGTPGKILSNGHNDSNNEVDASSNHRGALVAGSDNQPCFGTTTDGSNVCGGSGSQRRILALDNGEVIWDFAGNVWQWVDAEVVRKDQPQSETAGKLDRGWIWSEFSVGGKKTVILDNGSGQSLGYDAFRPTNSNWNSTNGVGRIYHYSSLPNENGVVDTFIRGGNWRHGYDSGAFSIHLSPAANKRGIDDVGFRCVANTI